ncbi:hypothetical protein BC792_12770 [Sphingobacterium allocomposti]|uniref:Uncharacterized protein n=1 Tax=Sphingobacterium allocomposti TaxID=415956 RepID=A0A5S5D2I2_9SPHI|nr:hypothetical protein [Sphingobacterium composti Yoo et al. 2007 non Ten et al. 2007]TYP89468.1 hypothetical protein BC792_12770 [Sphingobacterium composti Yoo et al. 2007 non Ten et al. 2007]
MQVNDIEVTKVPDWVRDKIRKGLKPKCRLLKVGQALPVNTLGWARNLKTQLNAETNNVYEYWIDNGKVYIGRIA